MKKKYLIGILGLLLVCSASASQTALASLSDRTCVANGQKIQDGYFPFPFSSEIEFPWRRIQGTWSISDSDCATRFVFTRSRERGAGESGSVLRIVQYDPASCTILARGLGTESPDSPRVIRATMTGSGRTYSMTVRAFNESDVRDGRLTSESAGQSSASGIEPHQVEAQAAKSVVVVSLFPRGQWKRQVSFAVTKLANEPGMVCTGGESSNRSPFSLEQ